MAHICPAQDAGCPRACTERTRSVLLWEPGKLQPFLCALHKIIPRRSTMGIEKPMKEIAVGLEVASAFLGSISQEPARSAPVD
jgi:hypothetical protein